MRVAMILVVTLTTGVLAMADDKKEDKKQPITFRRWIESQKEFINPVASLATFREIKGKPTWRIVGSDLVGGPPTVGSEVADKENVVWVIEKVNGGADPGYICYVAKKDLPKKD